MAGSAGAPLCSFVEKRLVRWFMEALPRAGWVIIAKGREGMISSQVMADIYRPHRNNLIFRVCNIIEKKGRNVSVSSYLGERVCRFSIS